jgi:hypothetical protein
MTLDRTDPVIRKLLSEKVDYLEQEGWTLVPDGTRFVKTRPDGSQCRIPYENIRDWTFEQMKERLGSSPSAEGKNNLQRGQA